MKNSERKLIKNEPIDLCAILTDTKPRGIIHCGAFIGEELPIYEKYGVQNRCWIEADPETFILLKEAVPSTDMIINVAVCDVDELRRFVVMDNGASSSLLDPKTHLVRYPFIRVAGEKPVRGKKLDTLVMEGFIDIEKYDFLYMDLQGAEHLALKGFEENIKYIDYILTEVNYEELYEGCVLKEDIDRYLSDRGFQEQWATIHETVGWGDAYYKRV